MAKKILLALVLSVLTVGVVFSQADQPEQTAFQRMAKNTITVDLGPTIIGVGIGIAGDKLGGGEGLSSSGFGIGAQYERQITQKFSVAGRFAYLKGGVGYSDSSNESGVDVSSSVKIDLSSFSIEGHARFYPWGETFFLDAMLGYANMAVNFSGTMDGTDELSGLNKKIAVTFAPSQGFFKLGPRIGWRKSFGKNGGFTFEYALGYSFGIGFGDTIGAQLAKQLKIDNPLMDIPTDDIDKVFGYIQNFIFIGGPRMTLAFGWRF